MYIYARKVFLTQIWLRWAVIWTADQSNVPHGWTTNLHHTAFFSQQMMLVTARGVEPWDWLDVSSHWIHKQTCTWHAHWIHKQICTWHRELTAEKTKLERWSRTSVSVNHISRTRVSVDFLQELESLFTKYIFNREQRLELLLTEFQELESLFTYLEQRFGTA